MKKDKFKRTSRFMTKATLLMFLGCGISFSSCSDDDTKYDEQISNIEKDIEAINAKISANEQGIAELQKLAEKKSIDKVEDIENGIKIFFTDDTSVEIVNGEQGEQGPAATIEISDEGFWVINGIITDKPSTGKDGEPGKDAVLETLEVKNGTWWINGVDTEVSAPKYGIAQITEEDKVGISFVLDGKNIGEPVWFNKTTAGVTSLEFIPEYLDKDTHQPSIKAEYVEVTYINDKKETKTEPLAGVDLVLQYKINPTGLKQKDFQVLGLVKHVAKTRAEEEIANPWIDGSIKSIKEYKNGILTLIADPSKLGDNAKEKEVNMYALAVANNKTEEDVVYSPYIGFDNSAIKTFKDDVDFAIKQNCEFIYNTEFVLDRNFVVGEESIQIDNAKITFKLEKNNANADLFNFDEEKGILTVVEGKKEVIGKSIDIKMTAIVEHETYGKSEAIEKLITVTAIDDKVSMKDSQTIILGNKDIKYDSTVKGIFDLSAIAQKLNISVQDLGKKYIPIITTTYPNPAEKPAEGQENLPAEDGFFSVTYKMGKIKVNGKEEEIPVGVIVTTSQKTSANTVYTSEIKLQNKDNVNVLVNAFELTTEVQYPKFEISRDNNYWIDANTMESHGKLVNGKWALEQILEEGFHEDGVVIWTEKPTAGNNVDISTIYDYKFKFVTQDKEGKEVLSEDYKEFKIDNNNKLSIVKATEETKLVGKNLPIKVSVTDKAGKVIDSKYFNLVFSSPITIKTKDIVIYKDYKGDINLLNDLIIYNNGLKTSEKFNAAKTKYIKENIGEAKKESTDVNLTFAKFKL